MPPLILIPKGKKTLESIADTRIARVTCLSMLLRIAASAPEKPRQQMI
jgi:hypothetical protein